MADDANPPNMSFFTLNNDLEIFKNNICRYLPSAETWIGYKGMLNEYSKKISVDDNLNNAEVFSITIDRAKNILDFQIIDNWYKEIKDYPYLYLKRKKDM